MSLDRTQQLKDLMQILQEICTEIMWVNDKEEEELVFDWGDKNIAQYIPKKQESYSVGRTSSSNATETSVWLTLFFMMLICIRLWHRFDLAALFQPDLISLNWIFSDRNWWARWRPKRRTWTSWKLKWTRCWRTTTRLQTKSRCGCSTGCLHGLTASFLRAFWRVHYVLQAYQDTLQTQWSWLLQITKCIDIHLKENAAYSQVMWQSTKLQKIILIVTSDHVTLWNRFCHWCHLYGSCQHPTDNIVLFCHQ